MSYEPAQSDRGLMRSLLIVGIICGVLGSVAIGWWLYTQARQEHARQVIADRLEAAAERMKQAQAEFEENQRATRAREEASKWVALNPPASNGPATRLPHASPSPPAPPSEEILDAADALDLRAIVSAGDKIRIVGRNRSSRPLRSVKVILLPESKIIEDAAAIITLPRIPGNAQIDQTVVVEGVKESFPANANPRLRIVATFDD